MSTNLPADDKVRSVNILYRNWKGKTHIRIIIPIKITFESTEWHPEEQWLLHAFDVEKQAERSFACRDILAWYTE